MVLQSSLCLAEDSKFASMDNEGWPIAKWLAERGIAAFVLKYRLMETPDAEDAFMARVALNFDPATPVGQRVDVSKGVPFAVAGAQTALRMMGSNAAKWNIDPTHVGLLGFSAGAMTTLGVTLANAADARPDFIAPIYGSMLAVTPPENAPPMFAAMAADDPLFNRQGFGLVESWQKAGRPVEFHLYESGGHGFGSFKKGTTSDNWFAHLTAWLAVRGLLTNAK